MEDLTYCSFLQFEQEKMSETDSGCLCFCLMHKLKLFVSVFLMQSSRQQMGLSAHNSHQTKAQTHTF